MEPEIVDPSEALRAALTQEDEGVTSTEAPVENGTPVENGHPAWREILDVVPDALRPSLEPKLAEWDSNVQKRFEKYKPLDEFAGLSPDELRAGLNLINSINHDPAAFYKNFGQFYNLTPAQAAAVVAAPVEDVEGEFIDPRITQLEENQAKINAALEQQVAQQAQVEAEKWMTDKQNTAAEKAKAEGIELDWQTILPMAAQTGEASGNFDKAFDNAVEHYMGLVKKFRPSASSTAPDVLPPSGALPSSPKFDPSTLDPAERRKYAAQAIAQLYKD
jgi:hypothetical protein